MLTYKGDPALKEKLVARAQEHRIEDRITQGTYWDWYGNGQTPKGCAIGCLATDVANMKRDLNSAQEGSRIIARDFGIPEPLAWLAEAAFEGLPRSEAFPWPEQFAQAIPVGVEITPETAMKWYEEWTGYDHYCGHLCAKGSRGEKESFNHPDKPNGYCWHPGARDFILEKMKEVSPPDRGQELLDEALGKVAEQSELEREVIGGVFGRELA